MQHGTVKWFNEKKGFGFIESKGSDYFVHYKDIRKEGYKSLKEGEKVEFESTSSPKGFVAKNVSAFFS